MDFYYHNSNNYKIAEMINPNRQVKNISNFMDMMASSSADALIVRQENIDESFFNLRSGFAGEIAQKATNYHFRMAIVGDFSQFSGKSLRAFMNESNRGNQMLFVNTIEEAIQRLSV